MRIWTKSLCLCLVALSLSGCSSSIYREDFNWSAVYEVYSHYSILQTHPFDPGPPSAAHAPLLEALDLALNAQGLMPAGPQEARLQQAVFVLNQDIAAGRLRVKVIAANSAVTWAFQLARESGDPSLIALEVWDRQTGNLMYRSEAKRGDSPEETVQRLLSRFPPNTRLYRPPRY